jgi:hypothetical protein
MGKGSKTLLAIESTLVVPVSAFISMYAAIIGAETAGHGGGSWGWGYLIAVPGGLVLGFILSSASLIALKQKGKLTFLSVFLSAFAVACAVFVISFIFHGVLDFVF